MVHSSQSPTQQVLTTVSVRGKPLARAIGATCVKCKFGVPTGSMCQAAAGPVTCQCCPSRLGPHRLRPACLTQTHLSHRTSCRHAAVVSGGLPAELRRALGSEAVLSDFKFQAPNFSTWCQSRIVVAAAAFVLPPGASCALMKGGRLAGDFRLKSPAGGGSFGQRVAEGDVPRVAAVSPGREDRVGERG